ncbi:restriction endonuclease subunit S [Vibrio sp. J2-4]|uniref:restriction endonuclease subunit S n=1 Tax=Vibrio sp. J2-4 TaxID=1507977 RepID=UPI001F007A78|nr:restriction endonuclease subunit S [Vibrio sp. J2-4]MCF7479671.1 restriction endonuclease subunit S [Vibrio sp. J2-4]
MGKQFKYSEYQSTGIDWCGEVPAHWLLAPCRSAVDHLVEKNHDGKVQNYLSVMANVGVIPYEEKGDVGNKKPDDLSKCKLVRKGQLVINSMNYSIGSYGMSDYDGVCSPVYIILQAKTEILHKRFALRVFENTPFQKHLATFGNGILAHRAAIGWDDIKGQYIPVPPMEEQEKILYFLDHETAKIDTLIDKQQQLIKLLKEKRQAVISHAVTKGLNSQASMKDSGVEWLGEVPEHWKVGKIGYYGRVINGSTPSKANISYWNKKEVAWLSSGTVNQYHITEASEYITEKALTECSVELIPVGTLVMGMIGQGKTRGLSAITKIEATINQNLAAIIPDARLKSEYGHLVLQAAYNEIRECARGGNQAALNCELISNFNITVPPVREQEFIVTETTRRLSQFDRLLMIANESIDLAMERRTALISATVTGKIDVRNWQAPANQEAQQQEAS